MLRSLLCLTVSLVLASAALAQDVELHRSLLRWSKDYRSGKYGEFLQGKNLQRYRPYLTDALLDRSERIGRPARLLDELEILLGMARASGRTENAELLVRAYLFEERKPPRKGAPPSWYVRNLLRKVVKGRSCPKALQAAFLDRLKRGLKGTKGSYTHAKEGEARLLLPIIGSFHNPAHRVFLQGLVESHQQALALASAEALAQLGSGVVLPTLAKLLGRLEDSEGLARVAGSILQVVRAQAPAPTEHDLNYTLDIALTRLRECKGWRSRMALVPIAQVIRSVASVPVLIGLLEEAAKGRDQAGFSGTLRSAIQEALMSLTGFYAPAYEPGKWRRFWEENKEGFKLAPLPKVNTNRGRTVSKGFFGIPVTGSRVVFILDVSGSMSQAAVGATVSRSPDGKPTGAHLTKLTRAKEELLRAVGGLAADSQFNVIFFGSQVRMWQKRLVGANLANKARLRKMLAKLQAGGGTALYDGLKAGLSMKTRRSRRSRYASQVDEVFLLSDGVPSPGLSEIWEPGQISERVKGWNLGARVRIHTVFLRTVFPRGARMRQGAMSLFAQAEKMMRELAKDSGGKFAVF
ncbi:MAG: hypothetical protein CSA62_02315 [Planctomycetota bacterium]|nr:MAG: hypothetical protein CSA62_02315 [Planctomycetota bacterium]